ncbi:DinB family protein [Paenibacillus sp. HJL G12]|uniref:DinB family protein n=1 Tax=Paenibacillus dendrobii TaxID=2691084 RepID=A0A7X3LKP5_9BACL|nr:DinB family protein [Paenibacillus dendrobii]MWV46808.1 DinB family protein [Paenibacillus dendrobii]
MRDGYIFGLMLRTRSNIIQKVEKLPEEKRNVIPEGFNNSIHWQIGHLLTVTNLIAFQFAGKESVIPESYKTFFGNGTKPSDWTEEPPAWDALIEELTQQCKLIEDTFSGKLQEPLTMKENFAKAETVDEALFVNINHENSHLGMISAMLKVLG